MKRLKLTLLIFAAFAVHITVNRYFDIFNAAPNIFLALTVSYAVSEQDFPYVAGVSVICALIYSAMSSNVFYANMSMFVICAAAAYEADKKICTMPKWAKSALFSAASAMIGGFAVYFVSNMKFSLDALIYFLVPGVIFNTAYSLIIYPILKKTIRFDKIHSSLLIS